MIPLSGTKGREGERCSSFFGGAGGVGEASVVDAQRLPSALACSRSHVDHHVFLESDGFVPTVYPGINTGHTLGLPFAFKDFGECICRLKCTHTHTHFPL